MLHSFVSLAHLETFLAACGQNSQFLEICGAVAEGMDSESLLSDQSKLVPMSSTSSLQTTADNANSDSMLVFEDSTSLLSPMTALRRTSNSTMSVRDNSITSSRSSISSASSSTFSSKLSVVSSSTFASSSHEGSHIQSEANKTSKADGTPMDSLIIRRACRFDCYCQCHTQKIPVSNEVFSAFNAPIFRESKGSKVECTEPDCAGATSQSRVIPSAFFKKAISRLMSSQSINIRYHLNTYRMVPEGSNAMRYVKHGNLEKLKMSINSGETTLWDTAPDGWSLLHTAAYARQLPTVKYLCELGADTEAVDLGGRKPADLAILKSLGVGITKVEEDIVQVFSKKDDYINDFEFTPIHIAVLDLYDPADSECPTLEQLIEFIDDANNAPPGTNWTRWKVKYQRRSPLYTEIIEQFRVSAVENHNTHKVIHNLLDQKDRKFHWTPLHWSSSTGRADKMKILIDSGADPFVQSNLNASIIHAAVESNALGALAFALEICERYPAQLKIDQPNVWGESPLIMAAQGCLVDCVRLLLEAGADRNVRQENMQVALHYAGLSKRGDSRRETVALLCGGENETSPHIDAQDEDSRLPIFDFLDDPVCIRHLINHGARVDLYDNSGKSVFHHACIHDENETLKSLLQLCTDSKAIIRVRDHDENTALIEALRNGSVDCAMTLLDLDDVGDTVGQDGWAAVHYATQLGDTDLLEAVLKHPSFVKGMKTGDGKTVQVVAMEAGHWCGQVKTLLRKYNSIT